MKSGLRFRGVNLNSVIFEKFQLKRLKYKLAVPVGIIVSIILVAFSIYNANIERKYVLENMKMKLITLSEIASIAASEPVWNLNTYAVEALGESLFRDIEVSYVVIKNSKENILYEKYVDENIYKNKHLIYTDRDIIRGNYLIGNVEIGITTYYQLIKVENKLKSDIIVTIITIIFILMSIVFISNWITRPLKFLIIGTEEISKGKLFNQISVNSKDEIGELTLKFNDMSQKLYKMVYEINKSSEKIQEAERKSNTIISNIQGIVYRCKNDEFWTMEYISDGCFEITGYQPNDLKFNKLLDFNSLILEEYREMLREKWDYCIENKTRFEAEYRIHTKNHEIKWVYEKGLVIYDKNGNVEALEGIITDITKLKNAEKDAIDNYKKLIESERRYGDLVNNIPGIVFRSETQPPWRMITISSGVYELTGYSSDEFVDNYSLWNNVIAEEDRERVSFVQNEEHIYDIEYRIKDRHGIEKWVYEKGFVFRTESGEKYIDGVIFDISERKNNEKELEMIRREMETIIEKRTSDLKIALSKIMEQEKLKLIERLVLGIAHEINTPLGTSYTISSHIQDINENISFKLNEKSLTKNELENFHNDVKEGTMLLEHNLSRVSELINNFKKISVSQMTIDKNQFKIKEYINIHFLSLKHLLIQNKITYSIDCDDSLEIISYQGAWSQILTNLIVNSVIHGFRLNNEGHISISVSISKDGQNIIFIYSDNGIGMNDEQRLNCFEPFYTTNREDGGSGLGLFIVSNVVYQSLNGNLELKTSEGEGTKFEISIPYEKS